MDTETLFRKLGSYGADIEGIDARFLGNRELYSKCLGQFFNEDGFLNLKKAINEGNMNDAFENAHAMKGLAGNLGLTPLYNALTSLVVSIRANDMPNIKSGYYNLEKHLKQLITLVLISN